MYAKDGGFLFSARRGRVTALPVAVGRRSAGGLGGLAASVRGGLSWGMTGAPFYATDVGGFYGDQRDPCCMSAGRRPASSPRTCDCTASARASRGLTARRPGGRRRLRSNCANRLMPYLWRAVEQACDTGLPVQRAMRSRAGRAGVVAVRPPVLLRRTTCSWRLARAFGSRPRLPARGEWRSFPAARHTKGGGSTSSSWRSTRWRSSPRRRGNTLGPAVRHIGELGAKPRISETWRAR